MSRLVQSIRLVGKTVERRLHCQVKNNSSIAPLSFRSLSSSTPLRRPPERRQHIDPDNAKLRTHFVSLEFGDYSDGYESWEEYISEDLLKGRSSEQEQDISEELKGSRSSQDGQQEDWEKVELELAKEAQKLQAEEDAKRAKWLRNAKPPVRVPIIDDRGRAYGRGGRKTAAARVWIQPGLGNVVVNRKDFVDYFARASDRELILSPFAATRTCGKFDVMAYVHGGGLTGQAGAIRHGLARALNNYNPDCYRPALKYLGYLTRDPRKVERKKIGKLKARKTGQWVRR